jgi:uncharacterized protein YggU (UPF0235/DUF167 family)
MFAIVETVGAVTFVVKVHPRANQACIEFFAKLLKVPRSSVTIASGQTSRNKIIRVAGATAEEIRKRIEQRLSGRTAPR